LPLGTALAAPDLLFKQDWQQVAAVQPNSVPHVAVNDDWPAFDDAHRELRRDIAAFNVQHQHLAHNRWLAADNGPLVVTLAMHDDVAKNSQQTLYWFQETESLIASSSAHAARGASAVPDNLEH
jgi:hypothetical protein